MDREKVIKGLESCIIRHPDDKPRCDDCPYESMCCNRLKIDALALLKDDELYIQHQRDGYSELEKEYQKLLKEQEEKEEPTFDDWTKGEGR